jgi:hypothetical protein
MSNNTGAMLGKIIELNDFQRMLTNPSHPAQG